MEPGARPADDADDFLETQVERTEMAWARTALASAALAAAAMHVAGVAHVAIALAVGACVAAPGLIASVRRAAGLRSTPHPSPPAVGEVAAVVASVAAADLIVLVAILR